MLEFIMHWDMPTCKKINLKLPLNGYWRDIQRIHFILLFPAAWHLPTIRLGNLTRQ
jgi:hypothetical protein